MKLRISSSLLARLVEEAARAPGLEVCGLLFGTSDRIAAAQSCANASTSPHDSFELDPAALLRAHRAARLGGPAMIGHYHSHPGGHAAPSRRDAEAAAADGAIWLILAGTRVTAWRAAEIGLFDCFVPVELVVIATP